MRLLQQGAGAWACLVGAPLVLAAAAPLPAQALELLRAPSTGPDPYAPVVAAVGLLGWAVVAWLWLVVLVLLAGRTPGLAGRAANGLSRLLAPRAVRRALGLTLGLSLALGATVGPAQAAGPTQSHTTAPAVTVDSDLPDLDWGLAPEAASPSPSLESAVAPVRPAGHAAGVGTSGLARLGSSPLATAQAAPAALPLAVPAPVLASETPSTVVVQRGDTLWQLAESSLQRAGTPPTAGQIAQAWPSWWAANRDAIGADPDLLLPGTVLAPP